MCRQFMHGAESYFAYVARRDIFSTGGMCMKKRSVLLKLFFSTLYLSAFTFGGGYAAMIEYINGH